MSNEGTYSEVDGMMIYTASPAEMEVFRASEAEQAFQRDHKAFLVITGEMAESSVVRDDDGVIVGLTVALQGEGLFTIPLASRPSSLDSGDST